MKRMFSLTLLLSLFLNLVAQNDKIKEIVGAGVELNDQGKYEEAISKYKEALKIDKNSSLAQYEMAYTLLAAGRYAEAVKYSKKVVAKNNEYQQGSYIILGSALDMDGKPEKAIKVYEEGCEKFKASNLLNYNLALTAYKIKDYGKAEQAAINGIVCKPAHCSSHFLLSSIMAARGSRVKSVLPLYYSLMLEPNTKRANQYFNDLQNQLTKGVEKKDDKNINIVLPGLSVADTVIGAAEMTISMAAATAFKMENKSAMDGFVTITKSLFSILGELKKENKGLWWEFYVPKFADLVKTDNCEAYCYYISQSANNDAVRTWIASHPAEMTKFIVWLKQNANSQVQEPVFIDKYF